MRRRKGNLARCWWLRERWLTQELGEGAYTAYRKRVPMLIPFGPKGD
jgi:hypothetical protein